MEGSRAEVPLLFLISVHRLDLAASASEGTVFANVLRPSVNIRDVSMTRVLSFDELGDGRDKFLSDPDSRFLHKHYDVLLEGLWTKVEEQTMSLDAATELYTSASQGGKLRPLSFPDQVGTCCHGSELVVRYSEDVAQPPPVIGVCLLLQALPLALSSITDAATPLEPALHADQLTSDGKNPYTSHPAHCSSSSVPSLLRELSTFFSDHCEGVSSSFGVRKAASLLRLCCHMVLSAQRKGDPNTRLRGDLSPLFLCVEQLHAVEGGGFWLGDAAYFCAALQRLTGVCGSFLNGQHWAAQALLCVLGLRHRRPPHGHLGGSPYEFSLELAATAPSFSTSTDSSPQSLRLPGKPLDQKSLVCPVTLRLVTEGGLTERQVLLARTLSRVSAEEENKNQEPTEDSVM